MTLRERAIEAFKKKEEARLEEQRKRDEQKSKANLEYLSFKLPTIGVKEWIFNPPYLRAEVPGEDFEFEISNDMGTPAGIILVKKCPRCEQMVRGSEVITSLAELGRQLSHNGVSQHRCRPDK